MDRTIERSYGDEKMIQDAKRLYEENVEYRKGDSARLLKRETDKILAELENSIKTDKQYIYSKDGKVVVFRKIINGYEVAMAMDEIAKIKKYTKLLIPTFPHTIPYSSSTSYAFNCSNVLEVSLKTDKGNFKYDFK